MTTANLRPGDLVEIDRKGRRFLAIIDTIDTGHLTLTPLQRGISYREATSREVVRAYKRVSRSAPGNPTPSSNLVLA
ncbi:hypothetical protein GKE82_24640 [Conexibacter sp. W3-3-2]|uniref:hypothetical protein n=1 Tax=Conexibacter sp. W3-3-2 TaxID=2675227 RepID=UPI0012B77BB7|nr:hypothetical protein [Conexibacter sp. W3-3-2]MTD47130.1 hypothetical protein [Conexibacter sp. W3-3-2]MTD47396.1 hypothetical protein [Conexibacter sp. W3-3-2]